MLNDGVYKDHIHKHAQKNIKLKLISSEPRVGNVWSIFRVTILKDLNYYRTTILHNII